MSMQMSTPLTAITPITDNDDAPVYVIDRRRWRNYLRHQLPTMTQLPASPIDDVDETVYDGDNANK
jgi:hypothetical protein